MGPQTSKEIDIKDISDGGVTVSNSPYPKPIRKFHSLRIPVIIYYNQKRHLLNSKRNKVLDNNCCIYEGMHVSTVSE